MQWACSGENWMGGGGGREARKVVRKLVILYRLTSLHSEQNIASYGNSWLVWWAPVKSQPSSHPLQSHTAGTK